ncbi:hypothetical protein GCM10010266_73220 [Streptomyces griseomycini]|nr:hypothetical protein GCM10010266_73220 [Streptomyces griseomycini]GGR60416.1 hypothetical protein GCM10015536_75740 [Streptomyces griseomycini]
MLTPSAEATSETLTAATPRASICSTAARSISSRRSATLNRTLVTSSTLVRRPLCHPTPPLLKGVRVRGHFRGP